MPDMSGPEMAGKFYFAAPEALWLLLLLPVIVAVYLRVRKRQWQQALRFSTLSVVEHLKRQPSAFKRLLGPLTMLLVIAVLMLGLARPTIMEQHMTKSVDMMLVMDISLSMLATDIAPDRITAARESAVKFVQSLPADVRIGLELFAGDNWVVTPPTRNHRQVVAYLNELSRERLQQQTQLGSAIQASLNVLTTGEATQNDSKPPEKVIVLLSDGDSQEGYPWAVAAGNARAQNVTIYTVGIGSSEPSTIVYKGVTLPVSFDESTLRQIARIGGGDYFRVFREEDFKAVYAKVREKAIHYEEKPEELAWLCGALALLLLLVNGLGQAFWVRRL